jgi:hypothetical protein
MKRALCVFVPSLLFSVNTSHAIELPTFAYTQTCTAEGGSFSNFRNCIATQRAARGNLKKNWRLYSESQKTSCVAGSLRHSWGDELRRTADLLAAGQGCSCFGSALVRTIGPLINIDANVPHCG